MRSRSKIIVVIFVLALVSTGLYGWILYNKPGLLLTGSSILYRENGNWVEIPALDQPSYNLITAPDGAVWGLTPSGLYRWDSRSWQNIYVPPSHPTDFKIHGKTLWLVMFGGLSRCDTEALTCQMVHPLNQGLSVATWENTVYAVTRDGQLVWFDGTDWQQEALSTLLPGFDASRGASTPELLFTDDGTLWLEWNQLWRYNGTWSSVKFGDDSTRGVKLIGTTPGLLWTEWKNGLVASTLNFSKWQLFTWEEMHAPGADWTWGVASAADGSVWVATKTGLLHYANQTWDLQSLPDNPLITAITITPNNMMWVQTSDSSLLWLLPALMGIIPIIFLYWSGRHVLGMTKAIFKTKTPEKRKTSDVS